MKCKCGKEHSNLKYCSMKCLSQVREDSALQGGDKSDKNKKIYKYKHIINKI